MRISPDTILLHKSAVLAETANDEVSDIFLVLSSTFATAVVVQNMNTVFAYISWSHTFSITRSVSPVISSYTADIASPFHVSVMSISTDIHSIKSCIFGKLGTTIRVTVPL